MPKEVKETENTFECSVSFFRFIDALNSFAIENSETLGVFVKKHLSPQDSEVRVAMNPCDLKDLLVRSY